MDRKKVLVCSVPCWNKKTGSDTFSSLMEEYGAENVANLYIRSGTPDSSACHNYFCISENAVIKSIFKRKIKTGKRIETTSDAKPSGEDIEISAVSKQYKNNSRKRNYFLLFAREILWKLGKWKSSELDAFLDEFKPDVVFFAMEGYIHFNRINRYILKRTGARGVGYFWDDNFTYKQSKTIGYRIYRFFQRRDLKKSAKLCSDFFAITPKTKSEADKFFGINCQVLTKPIDFTNSEFTAYSLSTPIQMLYTGKLIIGRFDTIKLLGKALDMVNKSGVKAELNVYTTTYLSEEQLKDLSPSVHILGAIPQSEVAGVQAKADVLLFAEALEGKGAKTARLSFSTKITDYFRSGKCILAVGNNEIAPIEYLRDEDAAIVATSFEEIVSALEKIVENKNVISSYALKAYECGKRNHDKKDIQRVLFDVLNG